jgi:lincosamide nucleotidyltransferase
MSPGSRREVLLARLDAIGSSLERTGDALALIALGSVGVEVERADAWSDLDFFAIVAPGTKAQFLGRLDWLEAAAPVAFRYRNTRDGYKAMFDDGIVCEFAVFEPGELRTIPFAPGRVVWKRDDVDASIRLPAEPRSGSATPDRDWLLGEALTNLHAGLGRHARGERLAAARLIQGHAVDRVVELAALIEPEGPAPRDPYDPARRFERRFPVTAAALPGFLRGYEGSAPSAAAILAFLERHFDLNAALVREIRKLLEGDGEPRPGTER